MYIYIFKGREHGIKKYIIVQLYINSYIFVSNILTIAVAPHIFWQSVLVFVSQRMCSSCIGIPVEKSTDREPLSESAQREKVTIASLGITRVTV